ncbi:hypothetical protein [Ectothiorhodospira shaposhnikovii]|uniref:hypothetical protein n=1 Tax=Ectothiorhodospira shaposhnikovii TaxID=1054 RepID=UPI0039A0AD25
MQGKVRQVDMQQALGLGQAIAALNETDGLRATLLAPRFADRAAPAGGGCDGMDVVKQMSLCKSMMVERVTVTVRVI